MQKRHLALFVLFSIPTIATALTLSPTKTYPITHNNKIHEVYELDTNIGQLEDGTWVKLVCIKKGMIGMPNVTMPSYRGTYVNKQGERCYVFVTEPEGTITYSNQSLHVYRTEDNKGFLSDGTPVRINCLPAGAMTTIALTPEYRGTYYLEDASGDKTKRQQCHVYAIAPTASQIRGIGTGFRSKPALSGLRGSGTGFR